MLRATTPSLNIPRLYFKKVKSYETNMKFHVLSKLYVEFKLNYNVGPCNPLAICINYITVLGPDFVIPKLNNLLSYEFVLSVKTKA